MLLQWSLYDPVLHVC